MSYAVISPCRNEQDYMRRTLDSVIAQSVQPDLWVIVDDGSTDNTPEVLIEYAAQHDWIRVIAKPDRGHRAVGPGVVEAFYFGLDQIDIDAYDYICKLDLDLDLPLKYFETLMTRMEANPRIGSCSGKAYFKTASGAMQSEGISDEMSVGASKFYRVSCFKQIGGFAREVMWDGIDCHKSRQLGWIACSWDAPELNFDHLRPMGSSQRGILTGRRRHGFGQYYMGSHPLFFIVSALFRFAHPPYVIGGIYNLIGYLEAALRGVPQHGDTELKVFIRRYQLRALIVGKAQAIAEINERQAALWKPV